MSRLGYLARQQDVLKCITLNINLCNIYQRMIKRKDCPYWLLEELDLAISMTNHLKKPLREHRDELATEDTKGYSII